MRQSLLSLMGNTRDLVKVLLLNLPVDELSALTKLDREDRAVVTEILRDPAFWAEEYKQDNTLLPLVFNTLRKLDLSSEEIARTLLPVLSLDDFLELSGIFALTQSEDPQDQKRLLAAYLRLKNGCEDNENQIALAALLGQRDIAQQQLKQKAVDLDFEILGSLSLKKLLILTRIIDASRTERSRLQDESVNGNRTTILHRMSENGRALLVELALNNGSEIDKENHEGFPALVKALEWPEVVRLLLHHGANPHAGSKNCDILERTMNFPYPLETMRVLLEKAKKGTFTGADLTSALEKALALSTEKTVALLLRHDAMVDSNFFRFFSEGPEAPSIEVGESNHPNFEGYTPT